MMNPVAVSIITNTFTEPGERARAIGIWGGVFGLSIAAGPVCGGLLVASVGWRGIFWVHVPIGVAAIVLTALFVPESRAGRARRLDPAGELLVIVLLASLTYAIIEGPRAGWLSAEIVALFGVAVAALAGLVVHEPRRAEPLLDLRFFRSAPFTGATLIAVSAFASLGGFLFLNTLYLQEVRGLSALHAGLYTLPVALMTLVFAPLSGRIIGRRGPRLPLLVAGVGMTAGAVLLTGLRPDTPVGALLACYVILGIGYGMVNAPITTTAVAGMPLAQAGVAAGIASTSRQVGTSLGVAVTGSVLASGLRGPLAAGFTRASVPAWWIITGCGAAVLVLALVTTGRWAIATAVRTAEQITAAEADVQVTAFPA
jgi:EmrB/QacA subfamily drug resistance transporter